LALLDAVDKTIPVPERPLDEPFILSVEHVYSIQGRGTVVTGKAERGKLKIGQEIEIIGYNRSVKSKVDYMLYSQYVGEASRCHDH